MEVVGSTSDDWEPTRRTMLAAGICPAPSVIEIESTSGVSSRDSVHVGDRLERAIENRAAPAEEIERGASVQPPRYSLRRTAFWLALTGVSLYLVAPSVL